MKADPVKKLLNGDIANLGMILFLCSLALPARYLVWRTWFGFHCLLVSTLGLLEPKNWSEALQFYYTSPNSQLLWGGVVNMLFIGTWMFSKQLFHPMQVACLALIYAVSLMMVLYFIREDLLIGFFVWIIAHTVMICGLAISTFSASEQNQEHR